MKALPLSAIALVLLTACNSGSNPGNSETINPVVNADQPDQITSPQDAPLSPADTDTQTDDPLNQTDSDTGDLSLPVPQQDLPTGACVPPQSGTTLVSKSTPVRADENVHYYPAMGPQCVLPASQFDGPGLSYGDFLLTNNAWNGQQSSWDWQQCISLNESSDGSILPSWSFDWGNEDDLQAGLFEWEVKSYPEIIYGAKSDLELSAPCESTGLPAPVSALPQISIGYSYQAPLTDNRIGDKGDEANNPEPVSGGDRNIAIESFFHSSCEITRGAATNMELELMVWLETGNERLPTGQAPVAQYTSGNGQTYDIYTKPDNYIAYVAQNTVRAETLNWSEFIDDAKNNAQSYGIKTLQDSWCMANIIFGSEIWWGEGSVNVDYYQITRQY